MSETPNEFEDRARARKAAAIASLFHRLHVGVDAAQSLQADGRAMACRAAHINLASDRTWNMAMEILAGLYRCDEAIDVDTIEADLGAVGGAA